MAGFDKDEFWLKILSMYNDAKENNYILKLDPEQVNELKALYIDLYIPMENLHQYDNEKIIKKMMTNITTIYRIDKDAMGNTGEIVELVNSVKYDGRNMYIQFAQISPVKMRRIELGKTRQQVAEKMGYSVSTVRNCETVYCDLRKQPETLIAKLAKALECDPEELF